MTITSEELRARTYRCPKCHGIIESVMRHKHEQGQCRAWRQDDARTAGRLPCLSCGSLGTDKCATCRGEGEHACPDHTCGDEHTCGACEGTGLADCPECDGVGYARPERRAPEAR